MRDTVPFKKNLTLKHSLSSTRGCNCFVLLVNLVFVYAINLCLYSLAPYNINTSMELVDVSADSHLYFWLQHFGDRFRGGHTSGGAGVTEIDEVPSEQ